MPQVMRAQIHAGIGRYLCAKFRRKLALAAAKVQLIVVVFAISFLNFPFWPGLKLIGVTM